VPYENNDEKPSAILEEIHFDGDFLHCVHSDLNFFKRVAITGTESHSAVRKGSQGLMRQWGTVEPTRVRISRAGFAGSSLPPPDGRSRTLRERPCRRIRGWKREGCRGKPDQRSTTKSDLQADFQGSGEGDPRTVDETIDKGLHKPHFVAPDCTPRFTRYHQTRFGCCKYAAKT
jgi:hypothetical protein